MQTVLGFLLEGATRLGTRSCLIGAALTYFELVSSLGGMRGVAVRVSSMADCPVRSTATPALLWATRSSEGLFRHEALEACGSRPQQKA